MTDVTRFLAVPRCHRCKESPGPPVPRGRRRSLALPRVLTRSASPLKP